MPSWNTLLKDFSTTAEFLSAVQFTLGSHFFPFAQTVVLFITEWTYWLNSGHSKSSPCNIVHVLWNINLWVYLVAPKFVYIRKQWCIVGSISRQRRVNSGIYNVNSGIYNVTDAEKSKSFDHYNILFTRPENRLTSAVWCSYPSRYRPAAYGEKVHAQ